VVIDDYEAPDDGEVLDDADVVDETEAVDDGDILDEGDVLQGTEASVAGGGSEGESVEDETHDGAVSTDE
jgi:hypothetical protein